MQSPVSSSGEMFLWRDVRIMFVVWVPQGTFLRYSYAFQEGCVGVRGLLSPRFNPSYLVSFEVSLFVLVNR